MASEFPKLPGYVPTQQIESLDFKRRSALQQDKNRKATIEESPNYPIPQTTLVPAPMIPKSHDLNYETTNLTTYAPFVIFISLIVIGKTRESRTIPTKVRPFRQTSVEILRVL